MNAKRSSILRLTAFIALAAALLNPAFSADSAAPTVGQPQSSSHAGSDKPSATPEAQQEAIPDAASSKEQPDNGPPSASDMAAHEEYAPLENSQLNPADDKAHQPETEPETVKSTASDAPQESEAKTTTAPVTSAKDEAQTETTQSSPLTTAQPETPQSAATKTPQEARSEIAETDSSTYYLPYYDYWSDRTRYFHERNEARREAMRARNAQMRGWAELRRKQQQLVTDARRRWVNPRGAYVSDWAKARQAYFDRLAEERIKQFDRIRISHPWGPYYYY